MSGTTSFVMLRVRPCQPTDLRRYLQISVSGYTQDSYLYIERAKISRHGSCTVAAC